MAKASHCKTHSNRHQIQSNVMMATERAGSIGDWKEMGARGSRIPRELPQDQN